MAFDRGQIVSSICLEILQEPYICAARELWRISIRFRLNDGRVPQRTAKHTTRNGARRPRGAMVGSTHNDGIISQRTVEQFHEGQWQSSTNTSGAVSCKTVADHGQYLAPDPPRAKDPLDLGTLSRTHNFGVLSAKISSPFPFEQRWCRSKIHSWHLTAASRRHSSLP
jgi:hypothetical protein